MKASESIEQMTLLDHFAGQIAASMVNAAMVATAGEKNGAEEFNNVMLAIPCGAYELAEAMLTERAKRLKAQENPQ